MDLIAQYTFGKTFYLTTEADRKAKDYVRTLLEESFPLEENIR
jgi:fructose-1,6-bisphosphatase/inositol monophosphatase family enzyme